VVTKLVQNTCTRNILKIHNYLKYVPSKKRRHPPTSFHNILSTIAKDNNILKLQGLLEHNDFIGKLATKIKQMLCIKKT